MDKDQRSQAQKTQKARRRFESRNMIYQLKQEMPCADCGNKYHPCQVDIVRKNGSKSSQLSKVLHKSKKFLLEEIKQCDFVCSNCNRMRTWEFQRKRRMEKTPEELKTESPIPELDDKEWSPE